MTPYPGIDMSALQQIMQQFQPSDADRQAAKSNAILTLGLGLLGARKGFEMDRLGQAGLLAANAYQDRIKQEQALRNQNMQAALPFLKLMQEQQFAAKLGAAMGGGTTPVNTALPAGAVGGDGMGGGTAATFGPSSQPGPVSGPTANVPAQPDRRQLGALAAAGKVMGMPDITPNLNFMYPNPVSLRPGGYALDPATGQATFMPKFPEGTDAVRNPDGTWSTRPIQGATQAISEAAAAQAGGSAAGKLPYSFQSVDNSLGGKTTLPGDVAMQVLRGGAPAPGAGGPQPVNAPTNDNPTQINKRGYYGEIPPYTPPTATIGTGQTTAGKLSDENRYELSKSILTDINNRANAATKSQGFSTAIGNLLVEVGKTGVTTPILNKAGRIAIAMGIDPNTVKSVLGSNSAPEETLRKLISMTAGQAVKQNVSGNRPTQFEFSTFLDATPNPGMQQQAYKAALGIMHGTENAARAEQRAAQDWYSTHQGDMTGFPEWWNRTNADTKYLPDKEQLSKIFATPASDQSFNAPGESKSGKTVVQTGTYNGRRVVKYSDGSVDYAPQ